MQRYSCDCTGAVGGVVLAILLALCLCFLLRRKRNKQVGEKRVAAKQQKEKKKVQQQQQQKKASGPWLGFLRSKQGGPGTGTLEFLTTIFFTHQTLSSLVCHSSMRNFAWDRAALQCFCLCFVFFLSLSFFSKQLGHV